MKHTRATLLTFSLTVGCLALAQEPLRRVADEPQRKLGPAQDAEPLTELKVIQRVDQSTDLALRYLRSKQQPDGSWSANNNAINALALLAYLARGHVPGRGPYRDVLERGKKFLLSKARADGFLGFGSMYEHGLATLALAEMYGMDPDPDLEAKLRKAVDLIVRCQSPAGGWRYNPVPNDQDLSVSVMQIVALRAANNAEIPVPAATFDNAIKYVRACGHPQGGFGYQSPAQTPQTTAAGTLSLQLLVGKPDDPNITKSLDVLDTFAVQWDPAPNGPNYFYYFHYYAVQAMYQAGGKHWNAWHPRIREVLLGHQNKDGSWDVPPGSAEAGVDPQAKVYSTAMACLVLDIYKHFLPAYQR
jgi:hypothetical protein